MGSLVFDLDEEEAGGGSGGTGGGAVAGSEDSWDGVGGATAPAGFDEGSDEVADHVMKEAVAGDAVDEQTFDFVPSGLVDGAGGGRGGVVGTRVRRSGRGAPVLVVGAGGEIGVDCGEGGEVMRAENVGGGLLEGSEVEEERAVPDVRGEHGGTDAAAGVDAVLVSFAKGAVAGVEAGGSVFDGEDANAGREGVIEGAVEVCRGDGGVKREGGNLGEGVDPGVGAA